MFAISTIGTVSCKHSVVQQILCVKVVNQNGSNDKCIYNTIIIPMNYTFCMTVRSNYVNAYFRGILYELKSFYQ